MATEQLVHRKERFDGLLKKRSIDAFVITTPGYIQYMTGFLPDMATPCVLVAEVEGSMTLIAPEGTSTLLGDVMEYCSYSAEIYQNPGVNACKLFTGFIKGKFRVVGLDINNCPGWVFNGIIQQGTEIVDISGEIHSLTAIKDTLEVECIRRSLLLNKLAYDCIRNTLMQGITEMELYKEISGAFNRGAETTVGFIADLVSGPRTVEVGGPPTMKEIQNHETVIADLLPCRNGYYCDTTRTFFVGSPGEEQNKVYKVLQQALQKGADTLRPGIAADEIYAQVAGVIEEKGYAGCFPHHAGHGIGIGSFEAPYFIKNCPVMLEAGMVVTIEPGIYLPDKFGIRIENNYLITEDGCENLFEYPLDIDAFVVDSTDVSEY